MPFFVEMRRSMLMQSNCVMLYLAVVIKTVENCAVSLKKAEILATFSPMFIGRHGSFHLWMHMLVAGKSL